MNRWHYTLNRPGWLGSILRDGLIKIEPPFRGTLCRAAWASSNPDFEATARKGYVDWRPGTMTVDEMRPLSARILIDPAFPMMTFADFVNRGRARFGSTAKRRAIWAEYVRVFVRAGEKMGGNPAQWFASFDPIPTAHWSSVEVWRDGAWVEAVEAAAVACN